MDLQKLAFWLDKRYGEFTPEFTRTYNGVKVRDIPEGKMKKKIKIFHAFYCQNIETGNWK